MYLNIFDSDSSGSGSDSDCAGISTVDIPVFTEIVSFFYKQKLKDVIII